MKKEPLNEHDFTKNMIDIIRGGYKGKLITENDDMESISSDAGDQKDTISPKKGDAVFNDELKKLQQTVDPRVEIDNFKIYPADGNVMIEGIFLKKEDENTGIKFKMSLAAGEIETSMNNIDLNDKVSNLLKKLKGYYENWVDEWALKIANDYNQKQN